MESPITNTPTISNEREAIELRQKNEEEMELTSVVEEIVDYYIANYYQSRFNIIKAKYLFDWDERRMVSDTFNDDAWNLSCHRHWLIDSIHETFTKEVLNQNFTPKMIPLHPCKKDYTDDAQDAYDWMYHRSRFETTVAERAFSEAILIWDSYVFFGKEKFGWYEIPTAEHISFFEMFLEPMATSFETSRYKIVRKIMDVVDIIKKYEYVTNRDDEWAFVEWMLNREAISETIWAALYQSDFSKIRDINTWEMQYSRACENYCNWVDGWDRSQLFQDWFSTGQCYEDLFWLNEDNTLCEVIEFWEKTSEWHKVRIMVNWYILPTNEIVFEQDPFGNIYYEESIGSPVHRGMGHKLMPRQREADLQLFIINNGMKMHAFPDWMSDSWLVDANEKLVTTLNWTWWGKVFKSKKSNIQGKQPFQPISYIDKDVLTLARGRLSEIEAAALRDVWLNNYMMGSDGRIERVRALWEQKIEQSRARLKTVKKSISTTLNKSYYIWLDILDWKFSKKLLERIDDDNQPYMADLNIKDIINWFEVLVSSEWFREESLKDLWQNILNTVNGMSDLLADEFGTTFDKKKLACALATSYWLDWLVFLTPEDRIKERREVLKTGMEMAKLEQEFAQQSQQSMQPQQQWPDPMIEWTIAMLQEVEDPRNRQRIAEKKIKELQNEWVQFDAEQFMEAVMSWEDQEIYTDERWMLFNG